MSTFEAAIPTILAHEGGWVNDPVDPGGETVYGWSMRTIVDLKITPKEMGLDQLVFTPGCLKLASKNACQELYRKHFWRQYGYGNVVDQTVATKLFDCSVNMGPKRAAILAQKAAIECGATIETDGKLGALSYAAINSIDPELYVEAFGDEMAKFYKGLIQAKPKMAKFEYGWMKRARWPKKA